MNRAQFKALAELTSLRDSKARQAAELVLVEGAKQVTAALAVGCSQQAVSKAVQALRKAHRLARQI